MPKLTRKSGFPGSHKFADFWSWLQKGPREVKTLGGRGHFSIVADDKAGRIVSGENKNPFKKSDAEKTWIRYQGARLAMLVGNATPPIHLRAGTYAQPNRNNPGSNTWTEVPNMICCPWIAAAIAKFLGEK